MANDESKPNASESPLFSATAVALDDESTQIEPVEAEEVMIDRTAFGFDPEPEETIDAEIETSAVPMDVRPVPLKYAAAAAMMLGVLGLFVGRQMTGGPAASMAASDFDSTVIAEAQFDRVGGKTYMLYASADTRSAVEDHALQLWSLGVETTIERNVPNTAGYALVGTKGFDLVNGLPAGVRRNMGSVVEAGFNPEPIRWPKR